jgi:hypothetical protein
MKQYQVASPDGGRVTIFRSSTSHQLPQRVSVSFGLIEDG